MNTILLDMHMNMHMNMNMNMCMCMLCTLWYFWVPSRALILLTGGKVEKSTNCCGRLFVGRCEWVYYCRGWWVWVGGFYLGRTPARRAGGPAATKHNRQGSRLALGEGKQGVCVADYACMGRAVGLRSGRGTGGTMLTTERSTL